MNLGAWTTAKANDFTERFGPGQTTRTHWVYIEAGAFKWAKFSVGVCFLVVAFLCWIL